MLVTFCFKKISDTVICHSHYWVQFGTELGKGSQDAALVSVHKTCKLCVCVWVCACVRAHTLKAGSLLVTDTLASRWLESGGMEGSGGGMGRGCSPGPTCAGVDVTR